MSEPTTSDAPPSSEGRQANGQFAKGNQFGPGNPFARKCAAFRAALMETVTEQDIKDIAVQLRDDAKAGDKAAIKLLFQYVIGKPQPAVDPDTLDVQEMRGYMAARLSRRKCWKKCSAPCRCRWCSRCGRSSCSPRNRPTPNSSATGRQDRSASRAAPRPTQGRTPSAPPGRGQSNPNRLPSAAPPSANGQNGSNGFAHGDDVPSPNGDIGDHTVQMILHWLRRQPRLVQRRRADLNDAVFGAYSLAS